MIRSRTRGQRRTPSPTQSGARAGGESRARRVRSRTPRAQRSARFPAWPNRHTFSIEAEPKLNHRSGRPRAHTPVGVDLCSARQPHGGDAVKRTRFRTIWVSDTHLGTPGCQARALLDFLDGHECEFLYLVGDIIDFWRLKRSPSWSQLHSDVIQKVLSKARAGTIVTLVPGNHDEYLRRFCDLQLGNIMVTREAIHRMTDGRLFLVGRGDEFAGITRCLRWLAVARDGGH